MKQPRGRVENHRETRTITRIYTRLVKAISNLRFTCIDAIIPQGGEAFY